MKTGLRAVGQVVLAVDGEDRDAVYAGSDAAIVQADRADAGVWSGQTPQDILATPPEFLQQIGLDEHLSPTRKNGLASLVTAIT